MSRIDVRKLMPLFLIPVIVLAMTGVAYAMWYETLKVNVTVNTGEVDVEWSNWSCSDTGIDPGYDKDVGSCDVSEEDYDGEGDVIKLNITLSNTYPCYNVTIYGKVDNIGTIPVKPYQFFIDNNHNGVFDEGDTLITTDTWYPLDLDDVSGKDVEFMVYLYDDGGRDGSQIDPNGYDTYGIVIHVLQTASENATYTFHLAFVFAQWNEVTTTPA